MAALADAALDEREREVLDRLVRALVDEYGDDLDGIWLYGSGARGERRHDESDVDVLVVTRSDRDDRALIPLLWRVLDELGDPRVFVDPRQRSRALGRGSEGDRLVLRPRRGPREDGSLRPPMRASTWRRRSSWWRQLSDSLPRSSA
jgi:predicted nucleotidyltransferase